MLQMMSLDWNRTEIVTKVRPGHIIMCTEEAALRLDDSSVWTVNQPSDPPVASTNTWPQLRPKIEFLFVFLPASPSCKGAIASLRPLNSPIRYKGVVTHNGWVSAVSHLWKLCCCRAKFERLMKQMNKHLFLALSVIPTTTLPFPLPLWIWKCSPWTTSCHQLVNKYSPCHFLSCLVSTLSCCCVHCASVGLNDLYVDVWEAVAAMTPVLESPGPTLSWFVRSDLTLGQETWFRRPLSFSQVAICQPARRRRPRGLTHAAHVSSVTETSAHSPFLTALLSVASRSTPRGTFCWQPWRSTTKSGGTRSQRPWARSTTPPPRCSTTQASSTGSPAWRGIRVGSAWTGTHT